MRPLLWLPLLFLVWANVDAGFIYGLFLLGLLSAATAIESWGRQFGRFQEAVTVRSPTIAATSAASLLACLLTPYGYRNYAVAFASLSNPASKYFGDLHSVGFRRPQDFLLLLLTMSGFLALGRRRSRNLFLIALLSGSAMWSFHAQRYSWLVTLISIAVIAGGSEHSGPDRDAGILRSNGTRMVTAAAVVVVLAAMVWLWIPAKRERLLQKVGEGYPVAAADYIREHHLLQPLFNNYEWGGFLAWYLPEYPVSSDGRVEMYGGETMVRYFKAMNAELPPKEEPALARARTLLLPRHSLMGEAFSTLPPFQVAYQDDVAVVLLKPE
jgi:hypothetical protein